MASRAASRVRAFLVGSAACAIVLALLGVAPCEAYAADEPEAQLSLEVDAHVSVDMIGFASVPVSMTPSSIEVGIDCGMPDMCGLDPCLCGAQDEWGACACNGLETVEPTWSATVIEGAAAVFQTADGLLVVPVGSGTTVVAVDASLPHHADAHQLVTIEVAPFSARDAAKIAAALAIVVLAVVAVRLVVKRASVRRGDRS